MRNTIPVPIFAIFAIFVFAIACLLVISFAGCKPSVRQSGTSSNPQLPSGWPADVPIMPGLELVFAERVGDFMIVTAKGTVYPPDIAKFYQSLPGWQPEQGATATWDQFGMLHPFRISKGDLSIYIQIKDEQSLEPYKSGDVMEVVLEL
jgi:hypothetical protein